MGNEMSAVVREAGLPDGLSPILAEMQADALEAGLTINWAQILHAFLSQLDWAKLIQAILAAVTSSASPVAANGEMLRKLFALFAQYAPQIIPLILPLLTKKVDPTLTPDTTKPVI